MEGRYYQVPVDVVVHGVVSQPIISRHWFKVGVALVGGSCLVVLSIMAASASASAHAIHRPSAAESTSLLGLTSSFRSPSRAGAAMAPVGAYSKAPDMYGIGSSPLAKLAMTMIQANNLRNRNQDVSVKAREVEEVEGKMKDEMSNMDDETKAKVEKLEEVVMLKARDMAGVTAPMNFFDPLGFSTDLPEGKLLFYREAEIKHGRVAMLASLGFLIGEQFHPLFGGNIDVPSYIAFQQTPLQNFWPAVLIAIAIPEIQQVKTFNWPFQGYWTEDGYWNPEENPKENPKIVDGWSVRSDRVSGDLRFDPLGLKPSDPKMFKEMQTKELNNGRLAMIAAAGMIAQELATGKKLF